MNWSKHAPGSPTSLGEPHTESWGPTPTAWHSTTSPTVPPAPPPRTTRCTRPASTGTQQQRLPTHLSAGSQFDLSTDNTIRLREHLQADKMAQQDSPSMKELGPYLHIMSHRACRTCGGNAALLRGLPSLPRSGLSLTITTTQRAHCSRLQPSSHLS